MLDSCALPGDVVELSMLLSGVVVVDTTPAASVVVDVPLPLIWRLILATSTILVASDASSLCKTSSARRSDS